jgi:predicted RNA-binding Zn-ribbon protein involved in translation (DUF1610 family)
MERGPSIAQLVLHFAKAMTKWVRAGTPVCSKEEYIKRRQICAKCSNGWTCPICGCQLWAKAAVETEDCPKGYWKNGFPTNTPEDKKQK